ncbi:PadR family transcriptional regulator [Halalkalicoccus jeotgali]|uniref:Transcription regulator n=1 Tax=Halalkalicoccus jeotgali (strain DSM 18796 / CECT 7217 / JCM 14584 / KCTC 4019 / B3) TaxID=795797 RepID=D8J9M3_HALJB|nr:PadR family transcriptional regulator [Halalkalicoccus jeotgali]ADJ14435.1 transcription regulator [Halalkalicoccus jeotgali B3]ELY40151.1 transcriptional regulator [Halalkalicoccus jeotgali B3]
MSDIATLAGLTAFQRDVLMTTAELGASHGLGIKSRVEEHYETEINHGRLYPNLDTLVEEGLVEKSSRDRRTNEYRVTERGRDLLRSNGKRYLSAAAGVEMAGGAN